MPDPFGVEASGVGRASIVSCPGLPCGCRATETGGWTGSPVGRIGTREWSMIAKVLAANAKGAVSALSPPICR